MYTDKELPQLVKSIQEGIGEGVKLSEDENKVFDELKNANGPSLLLKSQAAKNLATYATGKPPIDIQSCMDSMKKKVEDFKAKKLEETPDPIIRSPKKARTLPLPSTPQPSELKPISTSEYGNVSSIRQDFRQEWDSMIKQNG